MKTKDEMEYVAHVKALSASIFSGLKQLSYKGWIRFDRAEFKEKAHDVAVMQTAEASGSMTEVNDGIKWAKREIEKEQDRNKKYVSETAEVVDDGNVYKEWLKPAPKSPTLDKCRQNYKDLEDSCGEHALTIMEWTAKGMTQEQIGKELKLSQQAISKIFLKIRSWLLK